MDSRICVSNGQAMVGNKVNIPDIDRKGVILSIEENEVTIRLFGMVCENVKCRPDQVELIIPERERRSVRHEKYRYCS